MTSTIRKWITVRGALLELISIDGNNLGDEVKDTRVIFNIVVLHQSAPLLPQLPPLHERAQPSQELIGFVEGHGLAVLVVPATFVPVLL